MLAAEFHTVKQQLLSRFVNFVKKLLTSSSPEVCMVVNMVARCARSTTRKNLLNIEREVHLDPWTTPGWKIKEAVARAEVPAMEGWRIQYLGKLLDARREMDDNCDDTEEISSLIDNLCSS